MSKSDHIINQLITSPGLAVTPSHPLRIFLQWLGVTVVSSGIIVGFMAPRPDLAQQLATPIFLAEIVCLAMIIISTAMSAVWLCYPDLRQKPKAIFLPLLPTLAFAGLCFYRLLHPEITLIPPPEKVHGIDCAMCVTSFAIVPGLWMFHLLRRHATIYPKSAGAIAFLASASIGLLALKMVEPNDSVLHLLQWHISPMMILGLIGAGLGKKYLSW